MNAVLGVCSNESPHVAVFVVSTRMPVPVYSCDINMMGISGLDGDLAWAEPVWLALGKGSWCINVCNCNNAERTSKENFEVVELKSCVLYIRHCVCSVVTLSIEEFGAGQRSSPSPKKYTNLGRAGGIPDSDPTAMVIGKETHELKVLKDVEIHGFPSCLKYFNGTLKVLHLFRKTFFQEEPSTRASYTVCMDCCLTQHTKLQALISLDSTRRSIRYSSPEAHGVGWWTCCMVHESLRHGNGNLEHKTWSCCDIRQTEP